MKLRFPAFHEEYAHGYYKGMQLVVLKLISTENVLMKFFN
jgi:hypothetical protein